VRRRAGTEPVAHDRIARYADLAGTDLVATSDYTYDDAGRLTDLVHAQGSTTLADYSWTYDTRRTDPLGHITSFVYDDLLRLLRSPSPTQTGPLPPSQTPMYAFFSRKELRDKSL
jgi:uncharacterized protein RhaS with RHS repeats